MAHSDTVCNEVKKSRSGYHAMSPEIVMTSSFYFDDFDSYATGCTNEFDSYVYTRGTNPTTSVLEHMLAELEGGEACKVFASGMGAISATLLTFLSAGDHVLLVNTVYGASSSLVHALEKFGVTCSLVQSCRTDEIENALRGETRVIYFESPSSQKFELVDLEGVARVAHERGIMTVIDNTWSTPLFQQPLCHGIDISIQSCSKYIGGHSDIVCGAVIGSRKAIRAIEEFGFLLLGATASPMNSYLAVRGMRSLPSRLRTLEQNARMVIGALESDARIEKVFHPLCGDAWQHELADRYLSGYGSLLAFDLVDKDVDRLAVFVNALRLVTIGVSWGGFESLVLPAYRKTNAEAVVARGLDITHTRMYVGLEDPDEIVADVKQALDVAYGA